MARGQIPELAGGARPGPVEAARPRPDTSTKCARSTRDFFTIRAVYGRRSFGYRRELVRRPRSSSDLPPNFKAPNGLKSSDCRPNIDRISADARAIYGRPVYELCDLKIRRLKIADLGAGFGALRTSAEP